MGCSQLAVAGSHWLPLGFSSVVSIVVLAFQGLHGNLLKCWTLPHRCDNPFADRRVCVRPCSTGFVEQSNQTWDTYLKKFLTFLLEWDVWGVHLSSKGFGKFLVYPWPTSWQFFLYFTRVCICLLMVHLYGQVRLQILEWTYFHQLPFKTELCWRFFSQAFTGS